MAMTTEKIQEAFAACRKVLGEGIEAVRYGGIPEHLAFMCEEGATYAAERREKAMRWLGFVQGALWASGRATIEELKNMNRPDGPEES